MSKYTINWTAGAYGTLRLLSLGWSMNQACGLGGNLTQESVWDPTIVGDQGRSHGLAQVNGQRFENLKRFAGERDWQSIDVQIDFIDHELRTSEHAAGDRLKVASTIEDATAAAIGYERPAGYSVEHPERGNGWDRRLAYAKQLFAILNAAPAAAPSPTPIIAPPTSSKPTSAPAAAVAVKPAIGAMEAAVRALPKGYLELGDNGPTTKAAQLELADYGYPLAGTGHFGQATLTAVKDFQRIEHLVVDGEIGPITAARLDFYHGRQLPAPPTLQAEIARPLWVTGGLNELGIHEVEGRGSNPTIMRWARDEGGAIARVFTDDDIAWCSLYANHRLTSCGLPGTETLWALDWNGDSWPNIRLSGPAVGAFIPMKREAGGHIAVIVGRDQNDRLMALGGNQSNTVSIAPQPLTRPLSYRWPKSVPLPKLVGFTTLPLIRSDGRVVSEA